MLSGKKKELLLIVLIIVAVLVVTPVVFGGVVRPAGAVTRIILFPFYKAADFFTVIFTPAGRLIPKGLLLKENRELKSKNQELETRQENYDFLVNENKRLSDLLNFRQENLSVRRLVAARVLGFSAGNWYSTMILDRGQSDGIQVGFGVVNENGVVGRIVESGNFQSVVLLITDPASSVSVEISRNSLPAVAAGQLGRPLTLKYVVNSADIKKEDLVVTAARSGYFPGGLPVGRVKKISQREKELFADVQVAAAVDFSKLNRVFVILK